MVSEMKTQTGTLTSHKSDLDTAVDTVYEVHEELKGLCKICLVEEDDPDNFFVSPCSCKGSCSIVHLNCLKKWIESKMVVKQHAIAISYNFTKFECEICKDPYPKIIKKN
jgi:E3 ubiquitin-protein ligase DOA10